mgnify:FL=1
MSEYKVKTDQFKDYELGDVVEYDDLTPLMQHCVDTDYACFEKVEDKFEVGDWIWAYGNIYGRKKMGKVSDLTNDRKHSIRVDYSILNPNKGTDIFSNAIRKATDDEIKQALVKEAKRRGYHGSKIEKSGINKGISYTYKYTDLSDAVYSNNSLYTRNGYIYRNGEWAELVDQAPDITINGYEAEFHDDYVEFGCAKIAVTLIDALVDDLLLLNRRYRKDNDNNRHISGIKIGYGLFSIDDIKEIAEYYEGKS